MNGICLYIPKFEYLIYFAELILSCNSSNSPTDEISVPIAYISVASVTQLRTCVIKIVIFKGGHLMW